MSEPRPPIADLIEGWQREGRRVTAAALIAEGHDRGYCVCHKPLQQLVDTRGLTCSDCLQPVTDDTYRMYGYDPGGEVLSAGA